MGNNSIILKESFFYKKDYLYKRVFLKDILYVKSEGSYCEVLIDSDEYSIVLSVNLKRLLERIDYIYLFRVHHSYAVNLDKIQTISRQELILGNVKVPIGKTYRKALKEVICLI